MKEITEEQIFQIAEKLTDEAFGKKGAEKYSERQELTVKYNTILTKEFIKLGVKIIE